MTGSINPYAPPETSGEVSPLQEQWYTEGTVVYVSDGAALPAIDLETGEISQDLIEVHRKFAIAEATFGLWTAVPGMYNLLPKETKRQLLPGNHDFIFPIAALLLLMAMHLFVIFWRPTRLGKCVRFKMHRNPDAEKKTKRTKIGTAVWYSLSVLCSICPVFVLLKTSGVTGNMEWVYVWMAIGVSSMFACAVWQLFRLPRIRYKGFSGKWLRLHGASDDALAHLRMIESKRTSVIAAND